MQITIDNRLYFERKGSVSLPNGSAVAPSRAHIATLSRNLEHLGYVLSPELLTQLESYTVEELVGVYRLLQQLIHDTTGRRRIGQPMYKGFHQEVMDASDAELYINAIIHYFSGGEWLPETSDELRDKLSLDTFNKKTPIQLGTQEDYVMILINLLRAKSSISDSDKQFIREFANHNPDVYTAYYNNTEFSFKEVMIYASCVLINLSAGNMYLVAPNIDTATDVLRLAVGLSNGDISLTEPTKFISFSRPQRKLFLSLLEQQGNIEEDMKRYPEQWKRLGERIHPLHYKKRFPIAAEAFRKIRNDVRIHTFNSEVEDMINKKVWVSDITDVLSERPGEFARRLDKLLRDCDNNRDAIYVLDEFERVAQDVAAPVLVQALNHFKHRNDERLHRVFTPKGNVNKAYFIDNELPELNEAVRLYAMDVISKALMNKFTTRESLGKVYIAPSLRDYCVPFSQRSASKQLHTVAKGSAISIPHDIKYIRLFVQWLNGNERTDLDLSTYVANSDWTKSTQVWYGNQRDTHSGIYLSGDIVDAPAPNGACEFIDIDIEKVIEQGWRYVIMSVYNYTDTVFVDLPEAFAGWMGLNEPLSGELFQPRTVMSRFDITADADNAIPIVFDLQERKVVWMDLSMGRTAINNITAPSNKMAKLVEAYLGGFNPNLFDLFLLHANARGELVDHREEADIVFAIDGDVTPYDTEVILAQYL